jgi:hypothetical protein
VRPYLEFIAVILLPTALGYTVIASIRVLRWAGRRASDRRYRQQAPEPIELLTGALRRLRAELEDLETRTGVPAKNQRLQALRGAYLDTLAVACRRLEISPALRVGPPGGERAQQAEIYRVEAALRQRGLDVREPAPR